MRKELLARLKRDAFVKKRVRLSSGKISNYYIDVRKVSLSPQGVYLISHLVWRLIKDDNVSAIGGPTLGADPIVSGVCFLAHVHKKKLKGFLIRKSPKKHGRQKLVEGQTLRTGEKVILVDDVATSGSSLVNAIDVLGAERIRVVKAIVVVDREEGAQKNLQKAGCPLVSLFTKHDFLKASRKK
ncbi:MAG: orotate phosphoribosyltransferase [Candidatus Omnitrophota bacterium]|nr:MAG: orotate phosphoribosyltransferase [Candidatus Omnitrophota bacterium]